MMLVDANLLVYARSLAFPQHAAARAWLDAQLNAGERIGLPWESLLAFVRVLSSSRIVERPETVEALWQQVEEWLAVESVWIPAVTAGHAALLREFMPHVSRPNLVHDAHLAALAVSHGLRLMTTDGDFARFPGLRWQNPLRMS